MRYLIIPDVHNKTAIADQILERALDPFDLNCDRVIFTGDFFDSFHDDETHALSTAKWLKEKLHDHRFDFIAGNHDTSYRWSHHYHFAQCSGFCRQKQRAIARILNVNDWNQFKPFVRVGKFFFSHAGIALPLVQMLVRRGLMKEDYHVSADIFQKRLDEVFAKALDTISALRAPEVYAVSYMRGGHAEIGGVTWCDLSEFSPIPDFYQVFGHSPLRTECVVKTSPTDYFYPTKTVYDSDGKLVDKYEMQNRMRRGCGCGIGIDTHLQGFAILDESVFEVYSCQFDKAHSDLDFTRRVVGVTKVWEHKHS